MNKRIAKKVARNLGWSHRKRVAHAKLERECTRYFDFSGDNVLTRWGKWDSLFVQSSRAQRRYLRILRRWAEKR